MNEGPEMQDAADPEPAYSVTVKGPRVSVRTGFALVAWVTIPASHIARARTA